MADAAIGSSSHTGDVSGSATGTEYFQLEHFGLSTLEVRICKTYGTPQFRPAIDLPLLP
jgi:hypothetical protein